MSRFLIACGGTGGHLAPGIAVAEELSLQHHECKLLISRKQVDSVLIRKYGHLDFVKFPGRAFRGGISGLPVAMAELVAGLWFAWKTMRRERPDVVLAFGGYLSIAAVFTAWLLNIPVALHEANSQPGRATRLLRRFATRLYLPEDVRLPNTSAETVRHPGYPVRRDVKHAPKTEARKRLGVKVPNKLLVIIGGSQGAAVLNEWVVRNFEELAREGISVYCVTGIGKGSQGVITEVSESGESISATFTPFSDSMGDVLSAADLVISRAGAGSIAEIIRCRVPSLLIPYPYAADDHQTANARAHERRGACVVVTQDNIELLLDEVRHLIFNDWMLSRFKENIVHLDRGDPASEVARDLLMLCCYREQEVIA